MAWLSERSEPVRAFDLKPQIKYAASKVGSEDDDGGSEATGGVVLG